jgi:hypothetical protein
MSDFSEEAVGLGILLTIIVVMSWFNHFGPETSRAVIWVGASFLATKGIVNLKS